MFGRASFYTKNFIQSCKSLYDVSHRSHWITTYYGPHACGLLRKTQHLPCIWQLKNGCLWCDEQHWIVLFMLLDSGVMSLIKEEEDKGRSSGPRYIILYMNCTLSQSTVNFASGCRSSFINVVTSILLMVVLVFLTPLFKYAPLVVIEANVFLAMYRLIDYNAAIQFWKVDKFNFLVCMVAYCGVCFFSPELGFNLGVALSMLKVVNFVARPSISVVDKILDSMIYRSVEQYTYALSTSQILIVQLDVPLLIANVIHIKQRLRIMSIIEEEDKRRLSYIILDIKYKLHCSH